MLGIDINLAVGEEWIKTVHLAEIIKQEAAPAAIRVNIQTMPTSRYWEKSREVDLGVTPGVQRPSGSMVYNPV